MPKVSVVIPCYHLVCYNLKGVVGKEYEVVIPCYHLVCYNYLDKDAVEIFVVIPCYHLVCYNREHKSPRNTGIRGDFISKKYLILVLDFVKNLLFSKNIH